MQNMLKEKMEQGNPVIGTFFALGGSTAVECLGISGLDFLIIDSEHGPFDVESSMEYIRSAQLRNISPLVRVKDASRASILKMLDIGAQGIIIPCVETVEEVKNIVRYGKYTPVGNRGFFYGRGAGYGFDSFAKNTKEYFHTCNEETLLLPQCETMGCLTHIEEIVAIEGVDGIFIGPYDLSISMGKPAEFEDLEFLAAIDRILNACKKAGKPAFIFTTNTASAKKYIADGFQGIAVDVDAGVYIRAYQSLIGEIKE